MLAAGTPFLATFLNSCEKEEFFTKKFSKNFEGKVLIIGAGAAGLTAGYLLERNNIEFQIIEASSLFGGRVKEIENFADFPIDLGAEWIHADPSILRDMLTDTTVESDIEVIPYSPQTIYIWNNDRLKKRNFLSNFYSEYKFKNTTWYDFLENYIVRDITDRIIYNSPVTEVDYSDDKVFVKTGSDMVYEADKVLITVPISILKKGGITFLPGLPVEKINALDEVEMPPGLKVFIEFSEKFYPDLLQMGSFGELIGSSSGEKLFYDAAFRKDSDRHILGLFTVGEPARAYADLTTDEEVFAKIMGELDTVFEGKASSTYVKHVVQNWTAAPFIQGSYAHFEGSQSRIVETLLEPMDNKVFFAGEALTLDFDSTSTVHGAATSGYKAVEAIFEHP